MKLSVIITAGGTSSRYGKKDKLLEKLNGKEVILHSIEAFLPLNPYEIIVSTTENLEQYIKELTKHIPNIKFVRGGNTRQASIFNALKDCEKPDMVAIHDAARPLIKQKDIQNCIDKASKTQAAIIAVKAIDTIKKTNETGKIIETPNRSNLWTVQTPQIFDFNLIFNAHQKLEGQSFSDDSGMLESLGVDVYIVEGSYSNIKITTPKDLYLAEMLMQEEI